MIIKAFRTGVRAAWGYKRMILIVLLANLAFALAMTLPIYDALVQSTGHSVEARRLLDYPDWSWFTDFAAAYAVLFRGLSRAYVGLVLLYILVNTFFAGGILALLVERPRFTVRGFFSSAGHYFPRLFRLMVLALGFYFLLDRGFNTWAADGVARLTEHSRAENTAFYWNLARQGLYVFLFFFINMVFDYAKIDAVVQDSRFMLASLFGAFAFVFRNLGKTLGLYYLIAATQGVVLVIFTVWDGWITRNSAWSLALGVGLSQALLFARVGFRVVYFAGELALYSELTRAPLPSSTREPFVTTAFTPPPVAPAAGPEGLVQITLPPRDTQH